MNERKSIGLTFLTHVSLGNHNAGEGGRQLSNLKEYDGRPYISGQSVRHSIRDALMSITEEGVDCHPADSCGDIEECKICDIFGYMNTERETETLNEHPKRYSPLKVSPLIAKYRSDVATDMLLQFDAEGDDNNIAYREMTENVYHGGIMIDASQIGRREVEEYDSDAEEKPYERNLEDVIGEAKRTERIDQLVESVLRMTKFAGQARHMADFMPDLVLAVKQDKYDQRIQNALHIEDGELSIDNLDSILGDFKNRDAEMFFAGTHNPNVIDNWEKVDDLISEYSNVENLETVEEAFDKIKP